MSNRVDKPTEKIKINETWFWLVPYHINNQGDVAYMLQPVGEETSNE